METKQQIQSEEYPDFPFEKVEEFSDVVRGAEDREKLIFMLEVLSEYTGESISDQIGMVRNIIMLMDVLEEYFDKLNAIKFPEGMEEFK